MNDEQRYLILGYEDGSTERTWKIVVGEQQREYWEKDAYTLWVAPWPLVKAEVLEQAVCCSSGESACGC